MRFDTSQQMKLGQQMKLAPRMIQSMEILQMPLMALQERIDQELESNIALEQIEPGMELEQVREDKREEAKSKRISQQNSEQSKLIDQRKNNLPPMNFESNEDSLDGFDLAEFSPR